MSSTLLLTFQQYARDLHRFFTARVRCAATAEDLVQETYLRLQRIEQPHLIENLRTYMFRIAANLATDHLRTQGRRSELFDQQADFSLIEDPHSTPERIYLAKEELQIVEDALKHLSPLCQNIVILNRIEGMKHSDIAARLGISRSTVEKNIAKALMHFRRRLQQS
jgi:RNA polymerase sigma factor (sigma-70 family)